MIGIGFGGATSRRYLGVNVKSFGAKGDGATDDTAAIQAAVTYAKTLAVSQRAANTTPRGTPSIYFPSGIYKISSPILLQNLNGSTIYGDGSEATVFVSSESNIFELNQLLLCKFQDFGCAIGTVDVDTYSLPSITLDTSSTYDIFDWTAESGSDRFVTFSNIDIKGGARRVFDIGGTTTHSETYLNGCTFSKCDYVWYSNNTQSVNTHFNSCSAEEIFDSVFYYIKGGNLKVTGGSYVNPGNVLTIQDDAGGIGSSNREFNFDSVRFEMWYNQDTGVNPKVVDCLTYSTSASITFISCSNMANSNSSKTYFNVFGSGRIRFINSSFRGIMNVKSDTTNIGKVIFDGCRDVPTINQIANSGRYYLVEGINGNEGLTLSSQQDYNNAKFYSTKKTSFLNITESQASAATYSHTVSVPVGAIPTGYTVRIGKGAGVGIVINAYSDSGKTNLIFTIDTSTSSASRVWQGAVAASAVAEATMKSDGSVYIDLVTAGNAGTVSAEISLDYVML